MIISEIYTFTSFVPYMKEKESIKVLKQKIKQLERENALLKKQKNPFETNKRTVKTPKQIEPIFDKASLSVKKYFQSFKAHPELSKIDINGQRYVLMRAESISHSFLKNIVRLYADRPTSEAMKIGSNLLFDMAHLIGIEDARNFHVKMKLKDPISKLSAGPVHFAYTGWAFVDILPESNPTPDENFFLKYNHPFSFEADSWIKAKEKSKTPVCTMNAGYSSGWCEESFGIELTAVEITCRAKGDKHCSFIMAPPNRINEHLKKVNLAYGGKRKFDVPLFFERKRHEERMKTALKEKEILLKEIHHRVKNNLQVITSLLKLHADKTNDVKFSEMVMESQNRIVSMALIHEMLYANSNLSKINIVKYIRSLFDKLGANYNKTDIELLLKISPDASMEVDKMVPIGLILNEAISNSFKYAFVNKKNGVISISLEKCKLIIADNGVGLSSLNKKKRKESFGIELIYLLSEQIEAQCTIESRNGTVITISCNNF